MPTKSCRLHDPSAELTATRPGSGVKQTSVISSVWQVTSYNFYFDCKFQIWATEFPSAFSLLENAKIAIESLSGANLARLTRLSIGKVSERAPLLSRILTSLEDVVTRMTPDWAVEMSRVSIEPV